MIGAQASSFLASRPLAAMFPAGMSQWGVQNLSNGTDDVAFAHIKGNAFVENHNAGALREENVRWLKPRVWVSGGRPCMRGQ